MRSEQSRVLVLLSTILVALVLIGSQLYRFTIVESAAWIRRASVSNYKELPSHGPRGAIFDRAGRPLATSEPIYTAMLLDQDPDKVEKILPQLSLLLAKGDLARAEEIRSRVTRQVIEHVRGWRQFEDLVIETNLSQETVATFVERQGEFPGVAIVTQWARRYPYGKLASPILGYVQPISEDELERPEFSDYYRDAVVGKDGIELSYEQVLQGKPGTRVKLIDPVGRPVGAVQETPPEPGQTLVLSLDLELQQVAEEALARQIEWIKAQNDREANPIRGALVAVNVKTGAILAMAQVPTFDPNLFVKAMTDGLTQEEYDRNFDVPGSPLINWAITSFAPGSVYKMGVGLAGVELGAVGLRETIHCSPTYDRDPTRGNWYPVDQGHLALDMALAQSCNPYFYETGYRLGIDRLAEYLGHLGFGKPTGIDLPYEDPGINPTQASYGDGWHPGNIFSVAIGQGDVKVTPLQLAVYTATIANRGARYQPYLVSEIRSATGELVKKQEPMLVEQVQASSATWDQVQWGMYQGGNHPLGTASWVFSDFPVKVAAKTGSAETGKGYADALTVAYAPYDDPQIAVAVLVEGGAHGSWVSPPARAVFAHYLGIKDEKTIHTINKAD